MTTTGSVAAAAAASSQSIWSSPRPPPGWNGTHVSSRATLTPGSSIHVVAGVVVLTPEAVVVAAHDVEPVAERRPVAGLERGELVGALPSSVSRP